MQVCCCVSCLLSAATTTNAMMLSMIEQTNARIPAAGASQPRQPSCVRLSYVRLSYVWLLNSP
jgi:hypothetical protein